MFIDDDKIEISKQQLAQLLRDSFKLKCLEAGGVNNWSYCLETLSDSQSYWDYANKSDSEIINEYLN